MRKAARLAFLAVSSLLLTACEVPDSLEDFLNWREKFFLHVDPSKIDALLGPILGVLVALATLLSLWGVISNLRNGNSFWEGKYLTGITLLVAVGLILIYIPIATMVGESILPPDLTIDKVFAALHWELSTDLGKMVTAAWGVTFTLLIPLISALWQIVMLVIALVAISMSIAGRSIKGVIFAGAEILGWALFLVVYNAIVTLIGDYYPTWEFGPIEAFVNAFYTGAVLITMLACYIGVPWLAAALVPSHPREQPEKEQQAREERERRRIDWESIMAIPIPIPSDGQEPSEGAGDGRGPHEPEGPEPEGHEDQIPQLPASTNEESADSEEGLPPSDQGPTEFEELEDLDEEQFSSSPTQDRIQSASTGEVGKPPDEETHPNDVESEDQVPDFSEEDTRPVKPDSQQPDSRQSVRQFSQETTAPIVGKKQNDDDEDLLPQVDKQSKLRVNTDEESKPDSVDRATDLATAAGVATGQPEVAVVAQTIKQADHLLKGVDQLDPNRIVLKQAKKALRQAKETLEETFSSESPEAEDNLLPPVKGGE